MVRSGRIGELKSVEVYVGGPSNHCYLPAEPVPEGLDWDMWLGPAPWRPFNRRIFRGWEGWFDYSGGGMTGWGSHHFDIPQWALDADSSGPVEIVPPDGKDVKRLTFRYAGGVEVHHTGRMGEWAVVFFGSEGRIAVNRRKLRTWPENIIEKPIAADEVHLYKSPGEETSGHCSDFLRSIRTRQRPAADIEIGHRTMTVCHLGNIAYWLGRPLRWDPVREEFVGDPAANAWLDRPRRPPWTLS
jgi:predicted dehydrogenase